jgi:hypothetical protein
MEHQEFPPLAPEAELVLRDAEQIRDGLEDTIFGADWRRAYLSAGIREAMKQAGSDMHGSCKWDRLGAIADNLHAPPPSPPTREQMEEALQSLIDQYGARVAGEWTDANLQTLSAGIAHYCKVQP